jgi:hypothetical protein
MLPTLIILIAPSLVALVILVARLVKAPHSTVNSWKARITESRLHHLQLAAMAAGKVIAWDTLHEAERDAA